MKALMITLPSYTKWSDYEKEFESVEDEKDVLNFKVPFMAKDTDGITKVYLVYRGNIVGWQKFVDCKMLLNNPKAVGNRDWSGYFIQRTGEFHAITPIPHKDFIAFKYVDDEEFNS